MSFGNFKLVNKVLVDMSPFLSEALSKNGRNMTTFKKFMKQEERKFEIVNLNINTVRLHSCISQAINDSLLETERRSEVKEECRDSYA